MGRSKEDKERLRKRIAELASLGYSAYDISQQLNMPIRTVYGYIQVFREERARESLNTSDAIIGELIISQERRIRQFQDILSNGSKAEKLKALALLQHEDQLKIKRNQLAGFLPSDAPLLAVQNNVVASGGRESIGECIRSNYPELLERFRGNKARVLLGESEDLDLEQR